MGRKKDHAVESIAVCREQSGWLPPPVANTVEDLLGPRPSGGLDRINYDSARDAARQVIESPERDLGMELDVGPY